MNRAMGAHSMIGEPVSCIRFSNNPSVNRHPPTNRHGLEGEARLQASEVEVDVRLNLSRQCRRVEGAAKAYRDLARLRQCRPAARRWVDAVGPLVLGAFQRIPRLEGLASRLMPVQPDDEIDAAKFRPIEESP